MDPTAEPPLGDTIDNAADVVNGDESAAFAVTASRRLDWDANQWATAGGRVFGYARHRDPDALATQVGELVRLGVPEGDVYTDLSAPAARLPGLEVALSSLQAGDWLVVTAADRLARNSVGLGDVLDRIDTAGAVFAPQGIPMAPDVLRMSVHVTRTSGARARLFRDD